MIWSKAVVDAVRNIALFVFKSVNLIPVSIVLAKIAEAQLRDKGIVFTLTDDGNPTFASNFIEWFGILYGILLPLILVRVWEQLDDIDREFDKEADAVRLLYEDISYLPASSKPFAKKTALLLRKYVTHVIENYRYEVKPTFTIKDNESGGDNFVERILYQVNILYQTARKHKNEFLFPELKVIDPEKIRLDGDNFLQDIRTQYKDIIYSVRNKAKEPDPFVTEIFQRLNDIVDIRGDRIGFASQRLFESLRIVALITSIIFVVPFYIVNFEFSTPILDKILIIGVTLLVIFIYLIIDDFDEPFGGTWRITDDSWKRVLNYMDKNEDELGKINKKAKQGFRRGIG